MTLLLCRKPTGSGGRAGAESQGPSGASFRLPLAAVRALHLLLLFPSSSFSPKTCSFSLYLDAVMNGLQRPSFKKHAPGRANYTRGDGLCAKTGCSGRRDYLEFPGGGRKLGPAAPSCPLLPVSCPTACQHGEGPWGPCSTWGRDSGALQLSLGKLWGRTASLSLGVCVRGARPRAGSLRRKQIRAVRVKGLWRPAMEGHVHVQQRRDRTAEPCTRLAVRNCWGAARSRPGLHNGCARRGPVGLAVWLGEWVTGVIGHIGYFSGL